MKRRNFIKHATRSTILPAMLNGTGMAAFAKSPLMRALYEDLEETDKVLVLVYLGGGNDGLNTLVPVDQFDQLSRARPDVLLPENRLLALDGIDDSKLHPGLGGFQSLYNDGKLGIIQNVGYPNQSYSHFRSTDIWMTGADADELLPTGWLGRYLNSEYPNYPIDYPNPEVPDPLAIEIGYNLSVAFQGPSTGMGMVVGDPEWFYQLVNDVEEPTPNTPAGEKLKFVRLITKQSQVYGEVIKNAAAKVTRQGEYPQNELAEQLKIVARLIAGGLQTRLYMVSLHGFDTHDAQVVGSDHTQGEHATLLQTLGSSVEAFTKDLDFLGIGDRVMGATVSEFGRRIISNASFGTDHGAAAPMFVFGNAVNGGIYGANPTIPDFADVEDNLNMEVDFRTVYATILKNWFCVNESALQSSLDYGGEMIPIIGESACMSTATQQRNTNAGLSLVSNYPNPFRENTTLTFKSLGSPLQIQIIDQQGKLIETVARGDYPIDRENKVIWNGANHAPGIYYARFQDKSLQQSKAMLKVQ
ncbi:MAG: DUF1501 domain-containing protein [Saprospiraceae bacterium]|nr:DUF1501 domain-containing protein [Saprospiraceae bacterium]